MPNPNGNKNTNRSISADEVAVKCSNGQADICYVVEVLHPDRNGQMENVHFAVTFDETRMVTGIHIINKEGEGYFIDRPTVVVAAENTPYSPLTPGYYDAIKSDTIKIVDKEGNFENLATSTELDASPSNKNSLNVAERAAICENVLRMSNWSLYRNPNELVDVCNTSISAYDNIRSQERINGNDLSMDDFMSQRDRVERIMNNESWRAITHQEILDQYQVHSQGIITDLRHDSKDAVNTELDRAIAKNKLNAVMMDANYTIHIKSLLSDYSAQARADKLSVELGEGDRISYEQLKNAIDKNTNKLEMMAARGVEEVDLRAQANYLGALTKAAEYHPERIKLQSDSTQKVKPLMDQHLLERYDHIMSARTSDNSLRTAMGMYGNMSTRDFDGFMRARSGIVNAIAMDEQANYQKLFHKNEDTQSVEQRRELVLEAILDKNKNIDRGYAQQFAQSAEFLNMVNDRNFLYVKNIQGENVNVNGEGKGGVRKPEYTVIWGDNDIENVAAWQARLTNVNTALKRQDALTSETTPLLLAQKQYIEDVLDIHKQSQNAKYDQMMSHGISQIHFEYSYATEKAFNQSQPETVRLMRDAMLSKGMEFDFTTTDLKSAYKTYFALSDLKHFDATDTEKVINSLNALSDKSQTWTPEKVAKLMNNFAETQKAADKDEHEVGAMLVYLKNQRSLSANEVNILNSFAIAREQREIQINDVMSTIYSDIKAQEFSLASHIDKQIEAVVTGDIEKIRLEMKQAFDFQTAFDFNFDKTKNDFAVLKDVLQNHEIRNQLIDDINAILKDDEKRPELLERLRGLSAKSTVEERAEAWDVKMGDDERVNKVKRLLLSSEELMEEVYRLQQVDTTTTIPILSMSKFDTTHYSALVHELESRKTIPEELHFNPRLLGQAGYIDYMVEHAREQGYDAVARAFEGIKRDHGFSEARIAERNLSELLHTTNMTSEQKQHAFETVQQITRAELAKSNPENYMALESLANERLIRIYRKEEVPQHVQNLVQSEERNLGSAMSKLAGQLHSLHYNENLVEGTLYLSKKPSSADADILRYKSIAEAGGNNKAQDDNQARQFLERDIRNNSHFAAFDVSAEKNAIQSQIRAIDKRIAELEALQSVRKEQIAGTMHNRFSATSMEYASGLVGRVGMHVNNAFHGHAEGVESLGRKFGSWMADRAEEHKETKPWAISKSGHEIKALETKFHNTELRIDELRAQKRELEHELHQHAKVPTTLDNTMWQYRAEPTANNARAVVVQVVAMYGTEEDKAQANRILNSNNGNYNSNDPTIAKLVVHAQDIQLPANFDQRNAFYTAVSDAAKGLIEEYKKMPEAEGARYQAPIRMLEGAANTAEQHLADLDRLETAKAAYKSLDAVMKHSANLNQDELNACLAKLTQNAKSISTEDITKAIKEVTAEGVRTYEEAYRNVHDKHLATVNALMESVGDKNFALPVNEQAKMQALLDLKTLNDEIKTMSVEDKKAIVDSVYHAVASKFDDISREESQILKQQIHAHLFSEVGNSAMKDFLKQNAISLDEYQANLNKPPQTNYDKVDATSKDMQNAVDKYYQQPLDINSKDNNELANATMALVKEQGVVVNGNRPIEESIFKEGMQELQTRDPESYKQCVEAIKAYEPNENDGLANANRAVMKQVVEELEREVSVDKDKQVKLDEEKSVKNEPVDLSM